MSAGEPDQWWSERFQLVASFEHEGAAWAALIWLAGRYALLLLGPEGEHEEPLAAALAPDASSVPAEIFDWADEIILQYGDLPDEIRAVVAGTLGVQPGEG